MFWDLEAAFPSLGHDYLLDFCEGVWAPRARDMG